MLKTITGNEITVILIVATVLILAVILNHIADSNQEERTTALKEWLKYAVTMAEKELGSGTGQLKLRYVYDLFLAKFTWLAKIISFDTFSTYVDEALLWLENQLASNKAVATLVEGEAETADE